MKNESIKSKVNKSPEWKARKRQQHESNRQLRASLESQKASAGPAGKAEIQKKIDMIGAGKKV